MSIDNQSYEAKRAKALNQQWGPKDNPKIDLLIDIHNTTAAMGATLIILELDEFHIALARYVKYHMPEAVILVEDEKSRLEHPYLCTLGKRGLMVEVGAQPQGVYRSDITALARKMTELILAFCECESAPQCPTAEAYRLGETVDYPDTVKNAGLRKWMIHPDLQDKDFQPLQSGDPVFLSLDGKVVNWEGETTYPHFINEAAYYPSNVAFATASKTEI